MKTKKIFSSIFLALILCSFLGAFASTSMKVSGAVISPDSWFYASPYVIIKGDQPELEGSESKSISFYISLDEDPYNASVPAVSMIGDTFFEESIASEDFLTDGITRTFSSSIFSDLDFESAAGLYQTLQGIDEDKFSQYAVDRDTTVFTYATAEPFNETITNEMDNFDPDWTSDNFTCATIYMVLTFDRVQVDAFFAQALAKDGYGLVADEYSTNAQMITTLLDDVWSDHIFDMIYSPINETLLETGISISEEVEAVMSTNSSDTSINGTTKIVSMRNAAAGFIGQKMAPTTTIELDAIPSPNGNPFFGFEQTAVTYTIYFDVKGDYCTGDTVDGNMGGLFSLFQPGETFTGLASAINLGWLLFIGLGTAFVTGLITYLAIKDNKNRIALSILVGLVLGVITAAIYAGVSAFLNLTIL